MSKLYGPNNNLTEDQIDRLAYAIRDIQVSSSAMTFMLEEIDEDAKYSKPELRKFQCYDTTAIVAFCRAFEKRSKSCYENLAIAFTAEEIKLIDNMIYLRDKIMAH